MDCRRHIPIAARGASRLQANRRVIAGWASAWACSLVLAGCAHWNESDTGSSTQALSLPKMAPETLILEVAFIRVTDEFVEPVRELWNEVDEQVVEASRRRRLYENGLRCGTVGAQLPEVLRRALDRQKMTPETAAEHPDQFFDDPTSRQYHLQCRVGKETKIPVTPVAEDRHILFYEDGAVRGQSFDHSQCIIEVNAAPNGDGRVLVELTPKVEFGPAKHRPVGQQGMWRIDYGRDTKVLEQLQCRVQVSPGQTIVLSCTEDGSGVGGSFFASDSETPGQQRMMLLRVAQTQHNRLFSDPPQPLEASSAPL